MLSQILEQNRTLLENRHSYLLPQLTKIIALVDKLENKAGPEYFEAFQRKEFRHGEYLLCEGSICRTIWILEKGLVRLFDQKDGEQAIRYFFCPGEFIDDTDSSIQKIPSVKNIQAITDSTAYVVRRNAVERLAKRYPAINEIEKLALQGFNIWLDRRMSRSQHFSIKEQYIYMLHDQAPLINYLSNIHIASYLGAAAETISRKRKNLGRGVR
ncbi:MAG TPA: Crp/Fnr family transcriptional regulator [Bacteroidales bacterium]|nr:Crp/Fnr family transcriptional regulator [Bacteroidales bacterium]